MFVAKAMSPQDARKVSPVSPAPPADSKPPSLEMHEDCLPNKVTGQFGDAKRPSKSPQGDPASPKMGGRLRDMARAMTGAMGFSEEVRTTVSLGSHVQELGGRNLRNSQTDFESIRQRLKADLQKKEYSVFQFYWSKDDESWRGFFSRLAQHDWFERITLMVISLNAMWIAYDTDHNTAEVIMESQPQFQVAEHSFCTFFTTELLIRFLAFKRKQDCFKDAWFVFDSALVSTMVLETWILTLVIALQPPPSEGDSTGALGNMALLRIARLLRLSRMARMGRLLRAIPELLIQLKGLKAAMRSVLVTLLLLMILLYVFAIIMVQTMDDTEAKREFFPTVMESMYSLLIYGFFIDNLGFALDFIGRQNPFIACVFMMIVFSAGWMVQNMLIGVLCEVVSNVGMEERSNLKRQEVEEKLEFVFDKMNKKKTAEITKDVFMQVFENDQIAQCFAEVGVDVVGLLDYIDFIFSAEDLDNDQEDITYVDGRWRDESTNGFDYEYHQVNAGVITIEGNRIKFDDNTESWNIVRIGSGQSTFEILDEEGAFKYTAKASRTRLEEEPQKSHKGAQMVIEVRDELKLVGHDGSDQGCWVRLKEKTLSFSELVELVMQLRGDKEATVKDMVDMRKFLRSQIREVGERRMAQIQKVQRTMRRSRYKLTSQLDTLSEQVNRLRVESQGSESNGTPAPAEIEALSGQQGNIHARLGRVEQALVFARKELVALAHEIDDAPDETPEMLPVQSCTDRA